MKMLYKSQQVEIARGAYFNCKTYYGNDICVEA